ESGAHLRRVVLIELALIGLGHHVGAQPLALPRERVRHGRDVAAVDAVELLDQAENACHRIDVARNLLFTECEARKAGDVVDVLTADAHIEALESCGKSGAKSYTLPRAMSPRLLD